MDAATNREAAIQLLTLARDDCDTDAERRARLVARALGMSPCVDVIALGEAVCTTAPGRAVALLEAASGHPHPAGHYDAALEKFRNLDTQKKRIDAIMLAPDDLYAALELSRDGSPTPADAKRAFRRLLLAVHPDKGRSRTRQGVPSPVARARRAHRP